MNITIFGATGTIGRPLVEQSLAAGHDVTAFTRDAARVTVKHDRVQVVEGDVTDPAACLPAVKDADAVVVVLGAGRQGEVREAGTRAVVEAMQHAGGGRLVCQSTFGVGSSRPNLNPVVEVRHVRGAAATGVRRPRAAGEGRRGRATWTGRSCGRPPSPTRAPHRFDTASGGPRAGCG